MRIEITKSNLENKKMMAAFHDGTKKLKTVHFGANDYSDYTINKDPERKQRYINRHKINEDWNDPMKPGTLALYILWNKSTIKESIKDYKKKFNIL